MTTRFTSRGRGLLHLAHGALNHGEMLLQHRESFRGPSLYIAIIPTLCLLLELSNVIFVVNLKQFQILPVEVRGSDVLRLNPPGVELDAFSVGQFRQLIVGPGVISYHACADAFYI